jgi:DNA-binding transcriptional LysR family regulator
MLNIGDQSLLLQFAAIGLGIGLSSRAKMADFAHLELWPVEPVDARLEITGAAVWAESGLRNPAVQAFVNGVKQWLATCEGSELGFAGLRPAASD